MRLIARFAVEHDDRFEIVTVYDKLTQNESIPKENPHIKTIATQHPSAIWFERKMHDDFGIIVDGAFDNRPLVHQEYFPKEIYPMRKDFDKNQLIHPSPYRPYRYEAIDGDGVFQVAVGPIHAGIIEPGHFQFSQAGEEMLHLEVRHFYKYRGIEKMLEGRTLLEAKPIIERISGNESVAYQICWRDIFLQATQQAISVRLRKYHAFLLELERVIHHLTDLGFIPNDAGFGAALAYASRLSEEARRKMHELTGHRFGFGSVGFDDKELSLSTIEGWIEYLSQEMLYFQEWISDIPSLWDRLDTTGKLPTHKAVKYDTVGVVARASGLEQDRRIDPFYVDHGFVIANETSADVAARFRVRLQEVQNSIEMMKSFSQEDDSDAIGNEVQLDKTPIDGRYVGFVESSIGELFISIDLKDGKIERFFVRDPSFVNWQALHIMMRHDIIADFPLINKSCDLSYAGNDL